MRVLEGKKYWVDGKFGVLSFLVITTVFRFPFLACCLSSFYHFVMEQNKKNKQPKKQQKTNKQQKNYCNIGLQIDGAEHLQNPLPIMHLTKTSH